MSDTCNKSHPDHEQMEIVKYMDANLYDAAAEGKIDLFKDHTEPLDCLITPNKNTILHIYLTSPSKRSPQFIEEVLKKCPSLLLQVNINDDTPLHIAARYGHSDAAEVLINQAKASPDKDLENGEEEAAAARLQMLLRMVNKNKDTAIHEAARNIKSLDVVKVLAKEDPAFSYSANACGETPLYLAADNHGKRLVIEILKSCDSQSLAYRGPNGKTALHAAVMHRNLGAVKMLLEKMSSLAREKDENGWTPLHYAAYTGYSSMVVELLDKYKLAAYATDKDRKRTALHIAACLGRAGVVEKIISECPDCSELTDYKGWNVLHYAMISKSDHVVKAILQRPSLISLLNGKDAKGNTPLHLLLASRPNLPSFIRDGETDVFNFLRQKVDIILQEINKEEILKWIEDLGSGPHGKIVIGKNWEEIRKEREEKVIPELEKAKDSHLVAAALVATVTFAAAFTLPGGYISDANDSEQGSPILSRNSAFKAFVITDAIAMVLSTSSVFIHFIMVVLGYKQRYYWLIRSALWFIVLAMGAMVVAFVTGTYAVLSPSLGLAIATCAIGLSFFLYVLYTTIRLAVDSIRHHQAERSGSSIFQSLRSIWRESPFYFSCGMTDRMKLKLLEWRLRRALVG